MKQKKCIIFSAGSFEKCSIEKNNDDMVIAVDGGLTACILCNLIPDLCIGDFDSLDTKYKDQLADYEAKGKVVRLPVMKDVTDTYAALQYGLESGYKEFEIYGALGGERMEHSIANIQCLKFLKNQGANGTLISSKSMVMLLQNEGRTFSKKFAKYISVFAYGNRAAHVTIRNMKYEVSDVTLNNDYPVGISNEFIELDGFISVEDGCLLVIFTKN